ncbi:MAG TPA: hypothetical protein VMI34_05850 [Candidatus Bathyarchaeia archaeon]|nr:hypothetical protein [Candidatus Bathyarchaeia archaeon]
MMLASTRCRPRAPKRASSAFSSGAHDEWNILVRVNRRRPLGDQVAVFFDGRPASPAEMETEVAPGYELR